MNTSLASDMSKDIVIYINDFYPELPGAFAKLSAILGRPLRGIMLVDAERKASGKYKPVKDGIFEEIVVDFSSDAALAKALKPLRDRLLLITCSSEQSQLYFKRVIPHVPYVNTPTESSLDFCTDKGKMRQLFIAYDSSISPRAKVVQDASDESMKSINDNLTFPLILKPANLAASRLVNKVRDAGELQKVLKRSFALLEKIYPEQRGIGSKTMVVEEFVEGNLFSTDAYVDAFGTVYVLPLMHFQTGAEVGMDSYQVYQSETHHELTEEEESAGRLMAEKAIHAVGLRSSVSHIELFHTENGWKIIELGARPGGWRQEMYDISYGIDHALNELLVKIGEKPQMPTELIMHSTTFKIHAPISGVVTSISGVEEARELPYVQSININTSVGTSVVPSNYGGGALIDGLLFNQDYKQLDNDLAAIRANIKLDIQEMGA